MKQIIYITRDKVWIGSQPFAWTKGTLGQVFKANINSLKSADLRIVLGNDVSYVGRVMIKSEESLTRELIRVKAAEMFPIQVEDGNFDWKLQMMGQEMWAQVAAVELEILHEVHKALVDCSLKSDLLLPIGVLVGLASLKKADLQIIKWTGFETMTVVCQQGLVDGVYAFLTDDQVTTLVKQKWGDKVKVEVVPLNNTNFSLLDWVFFEPTRGSDREILNIAIPKGLPKIIAVDEVGQDGGGMSVEMSKLQGSKTPKWIFPALILTLIISGVVLIPTLLGGKNKVENNGGKLTLPTVTVATITATPSAEVSLAGYKIRVLNGSGVSGVAGGIKTTLEKSGFVGVETGNSESVDNGTVRYRVSVPEIVKKKVEEGFSGYTLSTAETLDESSVFDVEIVVGILSI